MLNLTVERQGCQTIIFIHGWLTRENTPFLRREIERRWCDTRNLVLDLDQVRFIDGDGLDLLENWADEGHEVQGGSLFVRGQIEHGNSS
jgi:anti-anti-sigma regulatory factor